MCCDACKGVSKCIRDAIISVRCAELWLGAGLHVYTASIDAACMCVEGQMQDFTWDYVGLSKSM